jgi:hypothetical protein
MLKEHLPLQKKSRSWGSPMTKNPIKNPLARFVDHFLNLLLVLPLVLFNFKILVVALMAKSGL